MGGVEDEMHDEAEEEKEERPLWGRGKNIYYYQDKQVGLCLIIWFIFILL